MSRLLEIFGKGIGIEAGDLLQKWLQVRQARRNQESEWHDGQLSKVVGLMGNKGLDKAKRVLRPYLFDHPNDTGGCVASAAILLYDHDVQRAIEELSAVYRREPNNTMVLYTLGHCYERVGEQNKAVAFYQDCLKFNKHLLLPRQRLAAIYFQQNRLDETAKEYDILCEQYPEDISSLVTLGYLHIARSDYEAAEDTFNKAILMHPDNIETEEEIDAMIAEGELYDAMDRLEELCIEQSERVELLVKRADVLVMLGASADAVEIYEQAVELRPNFLEATIKLGTQYMMRDEADLAAREFNKAVEINDQIVDSYIGLSTAQKLANNRRDALSTLSLAAAIQPNSSLLLAQAAALQIDSGFGTNADGSKKRTQDELLNLAIDAHRKRIIQCQSDAEVHYRLGVLMMSAGRIDQAVKAFQGALSRHPAHYRARTKLAVCLYLGGDQTAAMENILGPQCIDASSLEMHYRTALLYCDKVRFASSLLNLKNHMQDNLTYGGATADIAIVLQNLGLLDRATVMWDNLQQTTSDLMSQREN